MLVWMIGCLIGLCALGSAYVAGQHKPAPLPDGSVGQGCSFLAIGFFVMSILLLRWG